MNANTNEYMLRRIRITEQSDSTVFVVVAYDLTRGCTMGTDWARKYKFSFPNVCCADVRCIDDRTIPLRHSFRRNYSIVL